MLISAGTRKACSIACCSIILRITPGSGSRSTMALAPCSSVRMPRLAPATWNSGIATSTAMPGANCAHCWVADSNTVA